MRPAAERRIQRMGLAALAGTLAILLRGVWQGTKRPSGRQSGRQPQLLRTPGFYALASAGYFGLCYRLWRPLPLALSSPVRALAAVLGAWLYFPGLALVLWGRLTLAQMYDVSSTFGAQLYADHRLVTHGPFALVRHPMYLGVMVAGAGGVLLYRTWTLAFVLLHLPILARRARHEETALAAEFGNQWLAYSQRVPAWPFSWRRTATPDSGNVLFFR